MRIKTWLTKPFVLILLLALITFILTELAATSPQLTNQFYSSGIYPLIASFLSLISGWFSFSLDDLFYILLSLGLLSLLILPLFRKIKWAKSLRLIISSLALTYMAFYWLWGFNYYRSDLNERLSFEEAQADTTELMNTFRWLIDEVNQSYTQVDSIDKRQWVSIIENEYVKHHKFLKIDTRLCKTNPKSMTFSRFFAAATISGYYGPFFSEVHINKHLLPVELPLVLSHELSHRYGITSEAEANFYAWYICTHSDDQQMKYSANLYLLRYFAYATHRIGSFKEAVSYLRPEVKEDYTKVSKHWMALMNRNVEEVATAVNDAYLKTNKVDEGIADYEGVVKCVMDYLYTQSMK
ncbi:DUF3810 domain-containing protein [Carboxylicivirga linearis]|uniref:DUF3810 domain-containing protein n=1 Tax=Carboxylicivirga linearis TaxID=1628157 RepID=A0ABS5JQW6_9BACT|nr:DUF3810 domain-containing protein [Carboxylicivirga linearis]MBS2097251.1 DUF3810 domain-containing protein [Carboxylicivirga linearis]